MSLSVINCSNLLLINEYPSDATRSTVRPDVVDTCDQIGTAFRNIGFFVAAPGHGIDDAVALAEEGARTFFSLPSETKRSIDMNLSRTIRGYSAIGSEKTDGKADFKESLDLGTDHPWNKDVDTFMGANQFPGGEAGEKVRVAAETYHSAMERFGRAVMRALALHLDLPLDAMVTPDYRASREAIDKVNHLYRFLCYPPKPKDTVGPVQGIGAHTDYGALAMISATGGGLEVMSLEGEWIPAPFIPGAIIVNIGDMVETWTNGLCKSTLHRVLHNNNFTRFSFPFFYEPAFDSVIAPLGLFGKEALEYKPVHYGDHVRTGTGKSFPKHHSSIAWKAKLEAEAKAKLEAGVEAKKLAENSASVPAPAAAATETVAAASFSAPSPPSSAISVVSSPNARVSAPQHLSSPSHVLGVPAPSRNRRSSSVESDATVSDTVLFSGSESED